MSDSKTTPMTVPEVDNSVELLEIINEHRKACDLRIMTHDEIELAIDQSVDFLLSDEYQSAQSKPCPELALAITSLTLAKACMNVAGKAKLESHCMMAMLKLANQADEYDVVDLGAHRMSWRQSKGLDGAPNQEERFALLLASVKHPS